MFQSNNFVEQNGGFSFESFGVRFQQLSKTFFDDHAIKTVTVERYIDRLQTYQKITPFIALTARNEDGDPVFFPSAFAFLEEMTHHPGDCTCCRDHPGMSSDVDGQGMPYLVTYFCSFLYFFYFFNYRVHLTVFDVLVQARLPAQDCYAAVVQDYGEKPTHGIPHVV